MTRTKEYLGDGVYIDEHWFTNSFILTTENGIAITNQIILEPEVAEEMIRYIQRATEGPQT